MGGLGNGRRGGRSPPLMIAALIACILVLGFNYWVSSSRNLELQTKLYELEGQMRRGVAERGAAEIKRTEYEKEIQRQREQMSHMESLFKRQLEGTQNICSQDKGKLQNNISTSAKTIRELKGQLNQLNDDLGKLQKELQSCQGNIKTLNKKLTFDMTHCNSQVLSQKELCDERLAAAKLEFEKKMSKLGAPPSASVQENIQGGAAKEEGPVIAGTKAVKTAAAANRTSDLSEPKDNEAPELPTNEFMVDKETDTSKGDDKPVPTAAAAKQDVLPPLEGAVATGKDGADASKLVKDNLTEDTGVELMDAHEEGPHSESKEQAFIRLQSFI